MADENSAAWLDAKGKQLRVGDASMHTPEKGEVLIRNQAIAVNPVECKYKL